LNVAQRGITGQRQRGNDRSPHRVRSCRRGLPEPIGRLAHTPTLGKRGGIVELAAKITVLRRQAIPFERFGRVPAAAPAFLATAADEIHRPGVTLPRGAPVLLERQRPVDSNPAAVEQHVAEVVLAQSCARAADS
jgi:hypothetical protein